MERQDLVGGYTSKAKLVDVVSNYQAPLAMIALVHLRGAQKYEAYSWFDTPWTGGSTVVDNLEALYRHFTAITQGKILDREGLPHIFHMCCRAGMMVTIYAKSKSAIKIPYRLNLKCNRMHVGTWITPTEVQALADTYSYDLTDDLKLEEYIPYINDLLYDALLAPNNQTQDDLNYLFKVICTYAKKWAKKYNYGYEIIDRDNLDEESRKFYLNNIAWNRDFITEPLEPIEPEVKEYLYESTGTNHHSAKSDTLTPPPGWKENLGANIGPKVEVTEKLKETVEDLREKHIETISKEVPDCDPLSALDPDVLKALLDTKFITRDTIIEALNDPHTQYIYSYHEGTGTIDFEPLLGKKLPLGTILCIDTLSAAYMHPLGNPEKVQKYAEQEKEAKVLHSESDPVPDADPLSALNPEILKKLQKETCLTREGLIYAVNQKEDQFIYSYDEDDHCMHVEPLLGDTLPKGLILAIGGLGTAGTRARRGVKLDLSDNTLNTLYKRYPSLIKLSKAMLSYLLSSGMTLAVLNKAAEYKGFAYIRYSPDDDDMFCIRSLLDSDAPEGVLRSINIGEEHYCPGDNLITRNQASEPKGSTSESLRPGLDPIPDDDPQLSAVDETIEPSLREEAHRAYSED